jgi:flagellar assembly factor FliW
MVVQTSRFGAVELAESDIIAFPEGLIGFDKLTKYVLLDDPNDEIFAWLQSCDDADVAFPVLEPELFTSNYAMPSMTKHDLMALQLPSMDKARIFTIVTIPDDPTQMSANMKAPIVINIDMRLARQCVLQDSQLAIRDPIFAKLQQRYVASSIPIKDQAQTKGVAIRSAPSQTQRPLEAE